MIRILFQGDSITDGNRFREPEQRWDLNHQIGHSYAYIIAATLGKRFPGKYHFINRAIAGDCINKIAARWQEDTLDEKPDILSILAGINGNGKHNGVYPEGVEAHLQQFEATYRHILDLAKQQNPQLKIIIIEPFFLPVKHDKETYDNFMKVFRRKQGIIRKIAEDYHAIFIPVQNRLEALVEETANTLKGNACEIDPYAYWLWDGIHPTEAMQGLIAEFWFDATKDLLA